MKKIMLSILALGIIAGNINAMATKVAAKAPSLLQRWQTIATKSNQATIYLREIKSGNASAGQEAIVRQNLNKLKDANNGYLPLPYTGYGREADIKLLRDVTKDPSKWNLKRYMDEIPFGRGLRELKVFKELEKYPTETEGIHYLAERYFGAKQALSSLLTQEAQKMKPRNPKLLFLTAGTFGAVAYQALNPEDKKQLEAEEQQLNTLAQQAAQLLNEEQTQLPAAAGTTPMENAGLKNIAKTLTAQKTPELSQAELDMLGID